MAAISCFACLPVLKTAHLRCLFFLLLITPRRGAFCPFFKKELLISSFFNSGKRRHLVPFFFRLEERSFFAGIKTEERSFFAGIKTEEITRDGTCFFLKNRNKKQYLAAVMPAKTDELITKGGGDEV